MHIGIPLHRRVLRLILIFFIDAPAIITRWMKLRGQARLLLKLHKFVCVQHYLVSRSKQFVLPPSGGLPLGHDLVCGLIRPPEPPEGGTTNMARIFPLFLIC